MFFVTLTICVGVIAKVGVVCNLKRYFDLAPVTQGLWNTEHNKILFEVVIGSHTDYKQ